MMHLGVLGLVLLLVASPLTVAAQPTKIPKIGLLTPGSPAAAAVYVEAFRQGLRELAYIDGKTCVLEVRYGGGNSDRFPELAAELARLKMDVIVVSTDAAIAAVTRATRAIPIVMAFSTDPVGTGFVTSLAHPGGNVTGLSNATVEISGKRLALLKEVVPGLSRVAFLWNPQDRGAVFDYKETDSAARALHLELQSIEVFSALDLDGAFSSVTSHHAQALVVSAGNSVATSQRGEIAAFARRNRLPSVYSSKEYVREGGLMSYGPSITAMYRRAATYVDKILKGTKPADLPVEQPTTFELVINRKTVQALGITIPPSVLARADQIVE